MNRRSIIAVCFSLFIVIVEVAIYQRQSERTVTGDPIPLCKSDNTNLKK